MMFDVMAGGSNYWLLTSKNLVGPHGDEFNEQIKSCSIFLSNIIQRLLHGVCVRLVY